MCDSCGNNTALRVKTDLAVRYEYLFLTAVLSHLLPAVLCLSVRQIRWHPWARLLCNFYNVNSVNTQLCHTLPAKTKYGKYFRNVNKHTLVRIQKAI